MAAPEHLLVIGTRPEAIKTAPLVDEFIRRGERHRLAVVLSGQQDALVTSAGLDMGVDIHLPAWSRDRPPRHQRAVLRERLRDLFVRSMAGGSRQLIVQGDTTTSYCAAIAGAAAGLEVHHVEAGLRSGSLSDPFPEEAHRRAITRVAAMHYAPTAQARENLLREGIANERILVTGNTGIDRLEQLRPSIATSETRNEVLITLHRHENHGTAVDRLMHILIRLAARNKSLEFTWVVHPNPGIAGRLERSGVSPAPNLHIVPPMPHRMLVARSHRYALVMTDSGGLQEEATHLGIPLIVLRHRTERPEAVGPGGGVLCPIDDTGRMEDTFTSLIGRERHPRPLFGNGNAALAIVDRLLGTSTLTGPAQALGC